MNSMKTIWKDAFREWARIGALLHRAGNYAVVDRGALYPGEQWPMSFDRFQVIDFEQERAESYGLLDVAVRRADDLFGEELFALQTRVVESSRWAEGTQPSIAVFTWRTCVQHPIVPFQLGNRAQE